MRKNRRIAALLTAGLLSLTPCVSAGMSVFAEGETPSTYNITVNATKAANSEFAAYQIFTGKVEDGKLTGIQWGSGIPSTNATKMGEFLTALKAENAFNVGDEGANVFAGLTASSTAEDYSKAIAKLGDKSESANALARILDDVVTSPITDTNSANNIIGGAASGYYLVKETTPAGEENPISLNLLKVIGKSEKIEAKEDLPSIDKKIDEKGGIAANTASVGDIVPYIITTKVPDMTGYTKYFFVLNDTLSKGLTYQNDLSITVNGDTIPATDFTVETSGTDTTAIKVVFKDFYNKYKGLNDNNPNNDDIIVKYSAKVNQNADMTQTGNINTAQLTYSNNPNEEATPLSEDKPDEPGSGAPTGQTPQINTVTYVTQIDLTKTKADGKTPLAGATFTLEGYMKTVGAVDGTYYMEDEEGTFYRLADGTYTETAPNGTTSKAYESTNKRYKVVAASAIPAASKISKEVTTGPDGKINFAGLGEGTYTITETAAPSGFNMLKNPITVTITANGTIEGCEWGYVLDDGDNNATTSSGFVQGDSTNQSKLPLTVKNIEGSTLPSTGGVGTKLFYLFGGMLAVGSGVVLVTKKRMSYEK